MKPSRPRGIQQAQRPLHEHHVDVVVALARGRVGALVVFHLQRRPFLHRLDADVRRVADDGVEATDLTGFRKPVRSKHFRELRGPIEHVHPVARFVVQQAQLLSIGKLRPDERVAALDVARQVGQGALLEQAKLAAQRLLVLPFQHLQQQRQLGHLHGLRVDVHAVDVRRQDALPLGRGQPPLAARGLVDRQRAIGLAARFPAGAGSLSGSKRAHFARCGRVTGQQQRRQVGHVLFKIPVQQVLVDLQQEGAGPAGDVGDA